MLFACGVCTSVPLCLSLLGMATAGFGCIWQSFKRWKGARG
jgi:hypothetical protein